MGGTAIRYLAVLAVLFFSVGTLRAQQEVHLGDCTFVPEANVFESHAPRLAVRSVQQVQSVALGAATGGRHNVLLQFNGSVTSSGVQRLAQAGVELSGYLGGNAYWAQLPEGMNAQRVLAGYGVRSVMATRPEWKASRALLRGEVPPWAQRGVRGFAFVVCYASNASPAKVREDLQRLGAQDVVLKEDLHFAQGELPLDSVRRVAALDYVQVVAPEAPESELENYEGAHLGGAAELARSTDDGGRGLTGDGIRAGVWDGNIEVHPDFSDRLTRMEFESESGAQHGTHVAGTMFGRGLQDARGRGMAPGLRVWAYNFGTQRNGKTEVEEMEEARRRFGITLTQHSYGVPLESRYYRKYLYLYHYLLIDQFSYNNPTVINVYSAGNDQSKGGDSAKVAHGDARYGTSTKRAKNVLHIGAVGANGAMTDFSSWGPMDDGRMLPTVCAKGEGVYSTKPGGGYWQKDGTSMACPTASGHIALIQERYRQISGGEDLRSDLLRAALVTAATDAGNKGPDYSYGFGILNAVKTVEILEDHSYFKGEFAQASTGKDSYTIKVPAGAKSLRVSLAWIDPVVVKSYAYGDSPLVNDLDLQVSLNGTTFLPLVCDPKQAAQPAKQKVDRVNNTEQVVVDDLIGLAGQDVTITVTPHQVAQGTQVYYVAYSFEREQARIVSPRNGDELTPGESFYLRIEGVTSAYEAEISTDGGKTYRHLGALDEFDATKPYCSNVKVKLPDDIAMTQEAKIRVITRDGKVVESGGFISIVPAAEGLTINQVSCGDEGFILQWKAAGVSPLGFVVLRSDIENGGYEKIAEVASGVTEYKLKGEEIMDGACYTVACKKTDGWGRKALAVLPHVMKPIVVKEDALPWQENFTNLQTPYFSVSTNAANSQVFRATDDPSMQLGAHMHLASIGKAIEDFDYQAPFAAKHKDNLVTYAFCGLDLRSVQAGKMLMFRVRVGMRWAPVNATRGPWFRVLLDGKPLRDAAGVEVHERLDGVVDVCYPIVGGVEHALAMQFVGKYNIDGLAIYQLAVEEVSSSRDVGLTLLSMPREAAQLSATEEVIVRLSNLGGVTQESVGLQLLRDGVVEHQTVEKSLLPYERREVTLPVDLATSRALGQKFNISVRADLPGDVQPGNNSVSGTAVNVGSVFAMPRGNIIFSPMGPIPVDPKKIYRLAEGERLLFTDDGGAIGDFYAPQVSTLKVLPSKAGRVVRVRFKEFSSDAQGAHLLVYNETVPDNLELKDCFLDKELIGSPAMSYSTVSRAADGALTFFVEALRPGKGWLAEIDEVPIQNALTIVSATAVGRGGGAKGEVPVRVLLQNHYEKAVEGVTLHYFLQDGQEGEIDNLKLEAKEQKVFEFAQKLLLKAGVVDEVKVWLDCEEDTDGTGNSVVVPALYDAYPIPAKLEAPYRPAVGKLEYLNESIALQAGDLLPESRKSFPRYQLSDTLALYKELLAEPLRLINLVAKEGEAVRLWIDWNDDKQFGVDELAGELRIDEGTDLTSAQFASLKGLAGASAGAKRARIAVGDVPSLADPTFANGLAQGSTFDFTVNVVAGAYPSEGDLQLNRVELLTAEGKQLTMGGQLPSDARIVLHVQNNGRLPFDGKFAVKVDVDGIVSAETVDLSHRAIDAIPAFGKESRKVQLELNANLSSRGKHTVTVAIEEQPVAVNKENNIASAEVYSCVPEHKNYALAFKSHSESLPEYLKMPAGYSKGKKQATVEFWAFLRESGFNTFMETNGIMVCSFYKMKAGYADNSLGIVLREGVLHTKANTLLPERWNHIAIVLDKIKSGGIVKSGSCEVTVYINGEPQELVVLSPDGSDALDAPLLGTQLNGMLDQFRLWNDVRTQEEVRANMYRSVPENDRADLAYEFSFSEGVGNRYLQGVRADGSTALAELHEANEQRLSGADGLWYRLSNQPQLVKAHFKGQVKVEEKVPDSLRVYFRKGTSPSAVSASFVTAWPCTRVLYNGQPVNAETSFDLTPGKTLTLLFESELFGEKYTQTVQFEGVEDKSDECDLLTLTARKDDNPGLAQDLVPSVIAPSLVIAPDVAPANPSAVKIHFTLSAGAKLLYEGAELNNGGAVDLTTPALLTVQAANGTSIKRYSLQLAVVSRITSTLADGVYTYGDAPVPITISGGSANAPLAWASTDASVASVADGKLHIGRPGEATVSLWQKATGFHGASNKLQAKITVKKRTVEVTPSINSVEYNQGLPWSFVYEPMVPESDALELSEMLRSGVYALYDANGSIAGEGAGLLPGEYSVEPTPATIETERYTLLLKPQQALQVVPLAGKAALCFAVTGINGNAVEGAAVEVAGLRLLTDSHGVCAVAVDEGVYTFTVSKEGYQLCRSTLEAQAPSLTCAVSLSAARFALNYTVSANGGGVVYGQTEQHVAEGASGEPVEAIASEGYRFVAWSDGRAVPKRVDRGVRADVAVQAHFERTVTTPVYSITYRIKGGGVFADGGSADRVYEVREGDEIPLVTVVPASANAYFVAWSDGCDKMVRPTGQKATSDLTLTAEFNTMVRLPLQENFEKGEMPAQWRIESSYPNPTSRWKVFKGTVPIIGTPVTSHAATIITCETMSENPDYYSTSLRLPVIDVSNIEADIKVDFDWMYMYGGDKFSLSCSIDGGAPIELWAKGDGVMQMDFTEASLSIPKAQLQGKKTVELVFTYTSTEFSWYAAVDNINIYESPSPALSILLLSEPSGKATFTYDGAPIESMSVNAGYSKLSGLEVHPAAGYVLKEWTINGEKIAPSEYGKVCHSLIVKALLAREDEVTLVYNVEPTQAGVVLLDGAAVTYQRALKGQTLAAVVAKPNEGFAFSHWADNGSLSAERTGDVLSGDSQLTAIFKPLAATLTFSVKDGENAAPLSGARVALTHANGTPSIYTTAANGEVKAEIPYGVYSYMVMHDGYSSALRSSFSVSATTTVETVLLTKEKKSVALNVLVCDAETGEPLKDANVRVGISTAACSAKGIAHFDLLPASYPYSASCAGYKAVNDGVVDVPLADGYLHIALQKDLVMRSVAFEVADEESQPLPGAIVRVGSLAAVTNADGNAALELSEGMHEYNVLRNGYVECRRTVEVTAAQSTVRVRLERCKYTVALEVRNELGQPVEGAEVTLSGVSKRTDSNGLVAYSALASGAYAYSVVRDGYIPISGKKIFVISSDRAVSEVLEHEKRELTLAVSSARQAVPDASVTFTNSKGTAFGPFVTDKTGLAQCKLAPGIYTYEVTANGQVPKRGDFHFTSQNALLIDFERKAVTITCVQPAHGSLEVKANGIHIASLATVYVGCPITVAAEPAAHFRLQAVTINDHSFGNSPVMTEVSEDVTITAAFVPIAVYPVTYSVVAGSGVIKVSAGGSDLISGTEVAEGTELVVTAVPAEGFSLDLLKVNGTEFTNGTTCIVNAAVKIEASFKAVKTTAVESSLLAQVTAQPNPFVEVITLGNASSVQRYTVVSLQGVEVLRGVAKGEDQIAIAAAHLAPGVYLLTVYGEGEQRQMRIVKQH